MNNTQPNRLQIKQIKYTVNLANHLFSPISEQNWAMLLRSASKQHVDSRFDILVAKPVVTLVTHGLNTLVCEPNNSYQTSDDPFNVLQQVQSRYLSELDYQGELPFIGGALGYFAYDLGRRVETIPALAEHDLSTPDMAVGLYEWAVVIDHQQQQAYVVGQNVEQHWQWLQDQQAQPQQSFALLENWQSNMTKSQYQNKFAQVQEYLLSGDCYQINLAQRFSASYQGSEWQAYQQLEQVNQAPFSAFIRTEHSAILRFPLNALCKSTAVRLS